jgi:hypothetical protein
MENNYANVLVSGKLGDLIHSLWVCHHLYHRKGIKSNILMTDNIEKFEYGLVPTYNELYHIVSAQEYCYQFNLYNQEPIDYDTTRFRKSPYLYRACWTEILCQSFFEGDSPKLGAWIKIDSVPNKRIVISRRYKNEMTPSVIALYDKATSDEENEVVFLGSMHDYNLFPFKHRIPIIIPETIDDWFQEISKSMLFIGNQSSPLAMASALNVRRIAELLPPQYPDGAHYKNESKYYENFIKYVI